MKSLLVQNFGPIVNAGGTVIDVHKTTVFCGQQGAGKSSIAKLISEFSWIEKALIRGDFLPKEVTGYHRFISKYCAFHNIQNYFHHNSYLHFVGDRYIFEYKDERLTIKPYKERAYLRPQVMYIPAERNFMAAVEHAERIKKLPSALSVMIEDYNEALKNSKGGFRLPIDGYNVVYDKLNKVTWLEGNSFKVRVQEAASGFQSIIPMLVLSSYLVNKISAENDHSLSVSSVEEIERLQKSIQTFLKDKSLDDTVRHVLIKELNANIKPQRLINIVEEPEQNLYPSSQRKVLNELLAINNKVKDNELVITTHSPYILNYLTLAIKAGLVRESKGAAAEEAISHIMPIESCILPTDVAIYEIIEDGEISILGNYDGIPSDDNRLNNALQETNELFDNLLEIENM